MAGDDHNNDHDDLDDEFAAFEREAKAAAEKARAAMAGKEAEAAKPAAAASAPIAAPSDAPAEEEEDEFAAFEREAREAARKAQEAMSTAKHAHDADVASPVAAAAPAAAAEPEEEEDEFAKFEREAREAAARAQSGMAKSNAAATPAAAAAPTAAASTAAASEEAEAKTAAASAGDIEAREAAVAAAAATVKEKSARLFGESGKAASQTILVVGGGIAGLTAAIEAAETGYDVILVEKEAYLGGRVTRLNRYFPKLCHPTCGLEINYQRLKNNPRLKLMTLTEVTGVSGAKGNYRVNVRTSPRYIDEGCNGCGSCASATDAEVANDFNYGMNKINAVHLPHEHAFPMKYVMAAEVAGTPEAEKIAAACTSGHVHLDATETTGELAVGAIIWATGWRPYDANKLEVYSYAQSPDIINNVEMERLANHDGPTEGKIVCPSDGRAPKRVAMIQCAGSRDVNHLPYCSMICCLASLKHAAYVREQYPDADVDIYYIDIRAHDKMTSFYERIKRDTKVNFIKSKPAHIKVGADGRPVVHGERTIGDRAIYAESYDLVVLATGMEPSLPREAGFEAAPARDEYGFVINGAAGDGGQFAAGVAGGPFDVALSTQTATAAALKAIQAVRGN